MNDSIESSLNIKKYPRDKISFRYYTNLSVFSSITTPSSLYKGESFLILQCSFSYLLFMVHHMALLHSLFFWLIGFPQLYSSFCSLFVIYIAILTSYLTTYLFFLFFFPWCSSSLSALLFYLLKAAFCSTILWRLRHFLPFYIVLLCWRLYFVELLFFDANLLVQHHWLWFMVDSMLTVF